MKGNISQVTVLSTPYDDIARKGLQALTQSVDSLYQASQLFMQIPEKDWLVELDGFPKKLRKLANDCRQYGIKGIDTRLLGMSGAFAVKARALQDSDKKEVMEKGVECALFKDENSYVIKGTAWIMPDEMTTEQMELSIQPKGTKNDFAKLRTPKQQASEKKRLLKIAQEAISKRESRIIERKLYTATSKGITLKNKTTELSYGVLASMWDDFKLIRQK